ncbi:hypothetical protein [Streptomyces sp. NPDC005438]|uniref:hypothetical protein n=1 Tax=Streptomyces sp. NPDC005438 TaxID=3156880 RepID=UPI0033A2636E
MGNTAIDEVGPSAPEAQSLGCAHTEPIFTQLVSEWRRQGRTLPRAPEPKWVRVGAGDSAREKKGAKKA